MGQYKVILSSDYGVLAHHGIKGQKWGVRRFQNEDGSLTEAGLKRQAKTLTKDLNEHESKAARAYGKAYSNTQFKNYYSNKYDKAVSKNRIKKAEKFLEKSKKYDMLAQESIKQFYSNAELVAKTKNLISNNSNYIITYKRRSVGSGSTTDGGVLSTTYDKSKVRMNTSKNNKRYSSKQKMNGYELTSTKYYVY